MNYYPGDVGKKTEQQLVYFLLLHTNTNDHGSYPYHSLLCQ